jgi:hypothetical protein
MVDAQIVEEWLQKAEEDYPWSGHGVLMGKLRNPLIPEIKEIPNAGRARNPMSSLSSKLKAES